MSAAAHDAIKAAEANGMTFLDPKSVVLGVSKPKAAKSPVVVVQQDETPKPPTEDSKNYSDAFQRFDRDQQFYYTDGNGKRRVVNGKGVCRNCGYSLIGHTCSDRTPTILTAHGWQAVTPVGE
jgi:hypothetical protein